MKNIIIGMMMLLGIMIVSGCETKPKGNGTLKGVVLCYHNYIGTRPDIGAEVYVCKIPERNFRRERSRKTKIDIDLGKNFVLDSNEIQDCIEAYMDYKVAKSLRDLMSLGIKTEGFMSTLKMLGADTESSWEELRSKGGKLVPAMKIRQIPSNKIMVGADGTFVLELPPGSYFILITSRMRPPDDTYKVVTLSKGMTTSISYEFR